MSRFHPFYAPIIITTPVSMFAKVGNESTLTCNLIVVFVYTYSGVSGTNVSESLCRQGRRKIFYSRGAEV